jgi:hypothetical protein
MECESQSPLNLFLHHRRCSASATQRLRWPKASPKIKSKYKTQKNKKQIQNTKNKKQIQNTKKYKKILCIDNISLQGCHWGFPKLYELVEYILDEK